MKLSLPTFTRGSTLKIAVTIERGLSEIRARNLPSEMGSYILFCSWEIEGVDQL